MGAVGVVTVVGSVVVGGVVEALKWAADVGGMAAGEAKAAGKGEAIGVEVGVSVTAWMEAGAAVAAGAAEVARGAEAVGEAEVALMSAAPEAAAMVGAVATGAAVDVERTCWAAAATVVATEAVPVVAAEAVAAGIGASPEFVAASELAGAPMGAETLGVLESIVDRS